MAYTINNSMSGLDTIFVAEQWRGDCPHWPHPNLCDFYLWGMLIFSIQPFTCQFSASAGALSIWMSIAGQCFPFWMNRMYISWGNNNLFVYSRLKGKLYGNNPHTEVDLRKVFIFTRRTLDLNRICLLDAMHICKPKETISSNFLNMMCINLILIVPH